MTNAYTILVGKPNGRLEDNIKTDLKEIRCELDSGSVQEPVAGSWEHGNKHQGYIKGGEFLDRRTMFCGAQDRILFLSLKFRRLTAVASLL
jgi:hypothetical protein